MTDDFGIDPDKVFKNDGDGNPAFWTIFPDHFHGKVVAALVTDAAVTASIQAKFDAPDDGQKRLEALDHINKATVNCIGQHLFNQPLKPEAETFSVYNLLTTGTKNNIDSVIGTSDEDGSGKPKNFLLHNAFAQKDTHEVIAVVSWQVGRALFQASLHQAVKKFSNPLEFLNTLKTALKAELNKRVGGFSIPGLG